MDARDALDLLVRTAQSVQQALDGLGEDPGAWAQLVDGAHGGQHASDVVADAAALSVLDAAGVGVLSEETGVHRIEERAVVVVDPLDGSTNAARRIPWYAFSGAAVVDGVVVAAVVQNLANRERFEATAGGGATLDGRPIRVTSASDPADAIVGLNGFPSAWLGWRQYRVYGAGALDLCSVACGRLDAYVDCTDGNHGPWDYLAGMLVCREAGGVVEEATGRELVVVDHEARRAPVAAATPELLAVLRDARNASRDERG